MKKFILIFLSVLFLCGVFSFPNTAPQEDTALSPPHMQGIDVSPLTVPVGGGYVYDENDNPLYFHRDTRHVFNSLGQIVYDDVSSPITYSQGQYSNSLDTSLVVKNGKLVTQGDYRVKSISIADDVFLIDVYDGYQPTQLEIQELAVAIKNGDDFPAWFLSHTSKTFVTVFWEVYPTRKNFFGMEVPNTPGSFFYNPNWGEYRVFDLYGHLMDFSRLPSDFNDEISKFTYTRRLNNNLFLANRLKWGEALSNGLKATLSDIYPHGSLFDFLNIISDYLGFTQTIYLADNNMPIYYNDFGQLFDSSGFPLVGADTRPLFYRDGVFVGSDGVNMFVDGSYLLHIGIKARSVTSLLLENEFLYILFMADGKTLVPVYGVPVLDSKGNATGAVSFTYLNGVPVDDDDIIAPSVSIDDIYDKYPDTVPDIWSIWAWLSSIFNFSFFEDFLGGFSDVFAVVVLIFALILLLPLLPLIVRGIIWFIRAVAKSFRALFNGIIKIFRRS